MTFTHPSSTALSERCKRIGGLLFDKDGTLLDYAASWMPVNRRAASLAARGDPALAGRLLERAGADPATGSATADSIIAAGTTIDIARTWVEGGAPYDLDGLAESLDELFRSAAAEMVPVTDLAILFRRFRARDLKLGIASSDSEAAIRATMSVFGIGDSVDFVAGYDSGFGSKPDPAVLAAFCRATGLMPQEVAVIGDNTHDVGMGRAGGAGLTVGVLTGTGTRESLTPMSDICIDSICDLETLLFREATLPG